MVANQKSIAISGELGSGKSSVSTYLAQKLNVRRLAAGELHREIAQQRGVSTLELNKYAEGNEEIDSRVDQFIIDAARSGEQVVIDSRLAWFFIPNAFKVHLIVDPKTGAERIRRSRSGPVERYSSIEEAMHELAERSRRERDRFEALYEVDIHRLRNYDLVINTTGTSVNDVGDLIIKSMDELNEAGAPRLFLNPRELYPTQSIRGLRDLGKSGLIEYTRLHGITSALNIGYSYPIFFVIDGHRRLSAALQTGLTLLPGILVAEDGEKVVSDITAEEYLQGELRLSWLYDWEDAHNVKLRVPEMIAAAKLKDEGNA